MAQGGEEMSRSGQARVQKLDQPWVGESSVTWSPFPQLPTQTGKASIKCTFDMSSSELGWER